MPLFLTLLSIVLCYFSPEVLFPSLAPYHIQQFIMLPSVVFSLASLITRKAAVSSPQWYLVLGLWFAVVFSRLSNGWLGTSFVAFLYFMIMVAAFFLVSMNAFTVTRVRIVIAVQAACAVVMAFQSILAYHTGYMVDILLLQKRYDWDISRVRGFGILNDPNDFAQFLLVGIASLGVFWRRPFFANVALLSIPTGILLYAIFLTASRGAVIGLAVLGVIAVSRVMNKVMTTVFAVLFLSAGMLGQFTAGRAISTADGSSAGRIIAWGTGISLLKEHPLFGVGYGTFTEYNSLTAHNSFVLCFSELGLFGYFFWMGLLVTTVIGLEAARKTVVTNAADARFVAVVNVVRAALYCFMTTSFFLSRTYTVQLYVLLGIAAAVIQLHRTLYPRKAPYMSLWIRRTLIAEFASVAFVYVFIRFRTF